MKNYIKIIISSIFLFTVISGCEDDFLEKYPLDQVSSEYFFKTVNDLEVYINPFYLSPGFDEQISRTKSGLAQVDGNSDTQIDGDDINTRLLGTRTIDASGGNWSWYFRWVKRINYFFENYTKCEAEFEDYQQYLGEAYFFRALTYFQLVKEFGDVPWYDYVLETDSEGLYDARTPRNIVVDNILADLDTAAMYLSEDKVEDGTRINKWYALGFQSVVALYEGTWERYHAGSPFAVANADPDKYLTKAAEATETIMNSGLFELYDTDKPDQDYYDFFIKSDYATSKATLFWQKYDLDLEVYNEFNYIHKNPQNAGLLTKELADSYLCTDGDPISVSSLFAGFDTITNEMSNRDPRFTQTFFHPDESWYIEGLDTTTWGEGVLNRIHANSSLKCATGYMYRKFYNPNATSQIPESEENPIILFRYAQVLLNYAEAKAELGTISQADLDMSINLLRDRAGMPNLDLANITNDPDWDYPELSGIINEVRREREVELAIEGRRWDDIARWAAADELIAGKRPKGMNGNQFAEDSKLRVAVSLDENGFLDPFQTAMPDGWGFDVNRDYLDPLPQDEITLNPKLTQNPGWE